MQVLKFGGTSVGDAANINKTVNIILDAIKEDRTIVVASAIGGATDKIIEIGKLAAEGLASGANLPQKSPKDALPYEVLLTELENRHLDIISNLLSEEYRPGIEETVRMLFKELKGICKGISRLRELSLHTLDLIMSYGELLSTKIIEAKLISLGVNCKWIDSREIIKTYYAISQNIVDTEKTGYNIASILGNNNQRVKLFIVPGFIASDETGRTTTLGRGGSDYTASLIAAATGARILEIWTDVCGMMTADPHIVPEAKTIRHISYKEALELSHFGAKVVYPPTIQPVISQGVPIRVKNTFVPDDPGTLIEQNPPESHNTIKGISSSNKLALLSMEGSGMVGIPGYSSRLFDVLTRNEINIILITQASSVHTMLVAIDEKDASKAKKAVDELFAYEISLGKIEPLKVEKGYSILSLVGDDMKNQSGASGRMFEALGREGINIRAIAQGSSERNVSAVVCTKDVKSATRAIHNEFFGQTNKKLNLYIAGYGNVGKSLVKIITSQRESLISQKRLEVNIAGICNSKKMVFGVSSDRQSEAVGYERSIAGASADVTGVSFGFPSGKDWSIATALANGIPYTFSEFLETAVGQNLPNSIFIDCTSDKTISGLYPEILAAGLSIVTCNKIANSSDLALYRRIREAAANAGKQFVYDTNVGAALPIIPTIKQIVASSDRITRVEAMVSGSLNYIFSQYGQYGSSHSNLSSSESFASVIRRAQELGYTEPDPRTDLAGTDVLRKAIILAREIGIDIEPDEVGINSFLPDSCQKGTVADFYNEIEKNEEYFHALITRLVAEKAGSNDNLPKVRYIATIQSSPVSVSIGLKAIDQSHPFYPLTGSDAAVLIQSDFYPQPILISGAGAGGMVTASGLWRGILQTAAI